ncbi:type II secretion system F family protein [Rathayibacter sp. CAU 1779]
MEDVADVAQRLAVLLTAGVPTSFAWGYLAETLDERGTAGGKGSVAAVVVSSAARAARRGGDVPYAVAAASSGRRGSRAGSADRTAVREAWGGFAAAVSVATDAGAPLADALRDLAGSLRDLGQAQRDRTTALAGPRATARTVLALPAVGILFGAGLGFDTLRVLFATPMGIGCLVVGAVLMLAAAAWNRALLRRATPKDSLPGMTPDLLAIAMSGGGSVASAKVRVGNACERFGLPSTNDAAVESVLNLAERAGVGTVELLRAEAEQLRRDARGAAQMASAALAVRLMIPLAVCVLPAFMVLSVAPLVMSILSSTVRQM